MDIDKTSPRFSRRQLLGAGGPAMLLGVSLAGCDLSTDPVNNNRGTDQQPGTDAKGEESPILAEQVSRGELPEIGKRLPDRPLGVDTLHRIGTYGGEWRTAILGRADTSWAYRTTGYEHLMNWDLDWTEPVPNIAESVDVDDEATTFTFHLRPGMKWSDGEPFTADDIAFAYNDFFLNQDLAGPPPAWLAPNGQPAELDKIDDTTVRFTFSVPNSLFLANLAQPAGQTLTDKPKHYLSKYHKEYQPDIDQVAEREGFASWPELFTAMANPWERVGVPRLTPWVVTTPLGQGNRVIVERNPYYWKVDADGSQLPYLDRVIFDIIEKEQTILLKAANGELDMHGRHIMELQNKPVLARSREEGDFHFVEVKGASMNEMMIALNITHKSSRKRQIFQNKNFRIGLSFAINRQEVIDAAFQGQGEPWQAAPRREIGDLFDEELAKQYTDFDIDAANEYLDRAGFDQHDADGLRLGPDGQPISFQIDAVGDEGGRIDALEIVRKCWRDVGVDMSYNSMDASLMHERKIANDHDGTYGAGEGGLLWDAFLDPRWYFPHSSTESSFAIPWANWFNDVDGPKEEPPEETRRQIDLYNQLQSSPDQEEQVELFRQILQIAKDQFYAIGLVLPAPGFSIAKNNFHNVPESMLDSWMYVGPGPTVPARYFIA